MGQQTAVDAPVLEIERFEWAAPDRLELSGVWSGLRGNRFMRPTLVVVESGGRRRRLLALLDHKPWAAEDGEDWIAAFAWDGEPVEVESAELNVATGIDVRLPPPRRGNGKKPSRRFRHRAVSHDGTREQPVVEEEPPPKPRPASKSKAKPAAAAKPRGAKTAKPGDAKSAKHIVPDVTPLEAELAAAVERAAAAEQRANALLKERDDALERRKEISAEITAVKEAQEEAVRAARAEERESATTMLAEGAELRAGVERQREMAYGARDAAFGERDEAVRAMEQAIAEREHAEAERKAAFRERDEAIAERDRALRDRDQSLVVREKALQERDRAASEREAARNERDNIVRVHERGLPVVPPQLKHAPPAAPERSQFDLWVPRVLAAGTLTFVLIIVAHLFGGV